MKRKQETTMKREQPKTEKWRWKNMLGNLLETVYLENNLFPIIIESKEHQIVFVSQLHLMKVKVHLERINCLYFLF